MIDVQLNDTKLYKDLNNITQYAMGFLDGAKMGKPALLKNMASTIKELLENFIDASASVNPERLQHIYEWYQTGNSGARLFEVKSTVSNTGINFGAIFTQSSSVKAGSTVPFYDKAKIMESGTPVTIRPVRSDKLVFDVDGKTVFTKGPVNVSNPGGTSSEGGLRDTFKQFFMQYLSQSIFYATGMSEHLKVAKEFDNNFSAGRMGGRSVGVSAGLQWISGGIR